MPSVNLAAAAAIRDVTLCPQIVLLSSTGGCLPAHGAVVREPEIQNGAGHLSAEYNSQLGQRV